MWVKICANTTLEDTLDAIDAGADAVGFVFAPSKRQVTPRQVAQITEKLPRSVEKVGVFTSQDPSEIVRIVIDAGLDTVQLHVDFDSDLVQAIEHELPGIGIIQTVSWLVDRGAQAESSAVRQLRRIASYPGTHRVLIDSKLGEKSGGTGLHFDWQQAAESLDGVANFRIIVAGGLTPGNVTEAIQILNPWGVDVASGVEQKPGHKDSRKVREFIQNARAAVHAVRTARTGH